MYSESKGSPKNVVILNSEKMIFNTNQNTNDLQGSLAASVHFAQSQVFPAKPKEGDKQPHLVARRKTLLMVKSLNSIEALTVTVIKGDGDHLGSLLLNAPDQLPKSVYHRDDIPDDMEFIPLPGPTYIVSSSAELSKLSDPDGIFLIQKLQENAMVEIRTRDGRWVSRIHLPKSSNLEDKVVRVLPNAGYNSTIVYGDHELLTSRGKIYQFKSIAGQWIYEGELLNQRLIYAEDTWSVELPAEWIRPGITMRFDVGNLSGQLNNIPVGAPGELLINTIDIGMLTVPRDQYAFAKDPSAHREYFQTIPASRMIVGQYQSLYLSEVMLPDGTVLKDFDPSTGGAHVGTMRQRIGKELISLGINNANYGINSSEGEGEGSPFLAAQLTAHNSCGKYANGIIVHGLSGGGGVVTLDKSLGNEFSHEVGHNYGLGHYPGGFNGSVHRAADQLNSTWGMDMDVGKFIPNFMPIPTDKDICYDGQCQSPFYGRSFGADAMAGGAPMSQSNRFTLYTPFSATTIQSFMESKIIFSADSVTGFRQWDPVTGSMEPYYHRTDVLRPTLVSNKDLSESTLSALFNKNPMLKVAMSDGNWAAAIHIPPASSNNKNCVITIHNSAGYNSQLYINGQTIGMARGFRKSYFSNASSWSECILLDMFMTRITAKNNDLTEINLANLLAKYNVMHISMRDGNWSGAIYIPPASLVNDQRIITIEHNATYKSRLYINGLSIEISRGFKKYYVSDGDSWNERLDLYELSIERRPKKSGVPVTTLVGYYDPEGELPGYIYPALHGAYGFFYSDDSTTVGDEDCHILVESETGSQHFKLASNRIKSDVMNKFHINIAESALSRKISLVCKGRVVLEHVIEPVKDTLSYTINGE